jgi:hypothetical protein
MLGLWDVLAAGTLSEERSGWVMSHPDSICRTAGYVPRMPGGVGGGSREAPPHPDWADQF